MTGTVTESRPPGVYPLRDYSIEDWYAGDVDWEVVPSVLGPTWDRNPFWKGPRDPQGYILPKLTLGWQALDWAEANLLGEELGDDDRPLPFKFTAEQRRTILWFYAVDGDGRFLARDIVWQRLKGWGKDPLAAVICAIEFVGPCRFAGWAARDIPEKGVLRGEPVAVPHPRSWVQIAATTASQTVNTMNIFISLFSESCKEQHGIDLGKEIIYAYAGAKRIQAVTSSPRALEGNRPTLTVLNETHLFHHNNNGIRMSEVIERNIVKSKGGGARTLAITNAYSPSEESVARSTREAYDSQEAGNSLATGMMYDSLEAPKDARLRPLFPDEAQGAMERGIEPIDPSVKETLTRRYISRVLEAVKGDAWWLDVPGLVNFILSPKNKASLSRRFFYNQITASEDSWVNPAAVDAAIDPRVAELMRSVSTSDLILESGWQPVGPDDPIVAFFDGSKSDDSTAIVGCRISDGYCFLIGVWQKPAGDRGKTWLVPRNAVDRRVDKMFERFHVLAFWGDPSHAKDDSEDEASYWMPMLDRWMQKYKDPNPDIGHPGLDAKHWPVKGGLRRHAINFDMTSSDRTKAFIEAAEQTVEDFETVNDIEEFEPTFSIDGHPVLVQHLKNAIQHPDPRGWGMSLAKEQKDSPRKIDGAVCLVGARMLARLVSNGAEADESDDVPGEVWY